MDFKDSIKSRARGFGFAAPPKTYDWFVTYISQIGKKKESKVPIGEKKFLKNYSFKGKKRYQNMGRDRISSILRRIETFLGLDPLTLTVHIFRRTSETFLADSDISLLGLKRAGRWKSLTSAEEYIKHSRPVQED